MASAAVAFSSSKHEHTQPPVNTQGSLGSWFKQCAITSQWIAAGVATLSAAALAGYTYLRKLRRQARSTPVSHYVQGLSAEGFHKIHYLSYGDHTSHKVIFCVHGLTRNAHDFDILAQYLSHQLTEYRIICVDMIGRGHSDWLTHKMAYGFPQYLADITAVLAAVHPKELYWIGTSMGGLLGMTIAAQKHNPIKKLIINDIGPYVGSDALHRIAGYIGTDPRFNTLHEVQEFLSKTYGDQYGPLATPADFARMAPHNAIKTDDGDYRLAYDPGVAIPFKANLEKVSEINMWALYDQIHCPVFVLQGEKSDILKEEVAHEMTQRGPKATRVVFPDVGHTPPLFTAAEHEHILSFLTAPVPE